MGHTPFGYKIENGKAIIDEEAVAKIRQFYKNYLNGLSLTDAAKNAGIKALHGGAKRILKNEHYLGDDFYPAIIDKETFYSASAEIRRRSAKLGRDKRYKAPTVKKVPMKFSYKDITEYYDNPLKQAEYLYSLIESEEI